MQVRGQQRGLDSGQRREPGGAVCRIQPALATTLTRARTTRHCECDSLVLGTLSACQQVAQLGFITLELSLIIPSGPFWVTLPTLAEQVGARISGSSAASPRLPPARCSHYPPDYTLGPRRPTAAVYVAPPGQAAAVIQTVRLHGALRPGLSWALSAGRRDDHDA